MTATADLPAVAGTAVDLPVPVVGSLSPSRAADFKSCPLLYRLRSIDRVPERPSPEALRGSVVHAALERLFDLPATERTLTTAVALLEPEWQRLLAEEPGLVDVVAGFGARPGDPKPADAADAAEESAPDPLRAWLGSAERLLESYFALEDPQRLEPAEREQLVEVVLDDGLRLRGYVDRLDVAPSGDLRVVDYKTGRAPREAYEARALFQMKFYALVLWRTRGVVPRELRLLYLGDRDMLRYAPDAAELARFERTLVALWRAIERATQTGDFRPQPSRLCDWCDHRDTYCPEYGGTPPPWPPAAPAAARVEAADPPPPPRDGADL